MRIYYKNTEVWAIADKVREEYGGGKFPVDPEHIWEFGLGREIRPSRGLGIRGTEAILHGDFNVIAVDADKFDNPAFHQRIRFSIAHEIGHFFLHCLSGKCPRFQSVDEWLAWYDNLDDNDYRFLENHANQFAGRLLVPPDRLRTELQVAWDNLPGDLDQNIIRLPEGDEYFAKLVNRRFNVSASVITRRLKHEDLWPPDKFAR